jgi:hypothetical protein
VVLSIQRKRSPELASARETIGPFSTVESASAAVEHMLYASEGMAAYRAPVRPALLQPVKVA